MPNSSSPFSLLLGLSEEHLVEFDPKYPHLKIHSEAQKDFENLRVKALQEKFELYPVSIFRSFERQMKIWNRKALEGKQKGLSDEKNMESILRWSALPGFSRHHWGTEIDIIDRKALPSPDYRVELVPSEVEQGGPFYSLHKWLDQKIQDHQSFGFFRPFDKDLGGVAPEKWHLSYAPIAKQLQDLLNFKLFSELLEEKAYSQMELFDVVLTHKKKIYSRYINNTLPPPWQG